MSNLQQNLKQILYQDDTVKITSDQVTILKYYFPIPTAKTIKMIDIVAIHLKNNTDGQIWGTSPGKMDTWFAMDSDRDKKKQYLQLVIRDSDVKAAFSPSDPKKVISIIEEETTKSLQKQKQKLGYGQPHKYVEKTQEKQVDVGQGYDLGQKKIQEKKENQTTNRIYQQPLITQWNKPIQQTKMETQKISRKEQPIKTEVKSQTDKHHKTHPHKPQKTQTVFVEKKPQKGVLQSIGQKINQKIQGIKNVGSSVKQKYHQGKQKAYVSPDNKIDQMKQNIKEYPRQAAQINKGKENLNQGYEKQKIVTIEKEKKQQKML